MRRLEAGISIAGIEYLILENVLCWWSKIDNGNQRFLKKYDQRNAGAGPAKVSPCLF